MAKDKILIIGSEGQIGTELSELLIELKGEENVMCADIKPEGNKSRYTQLDATDKQKMVELVKKEGITQIYHLVAILSAKGELNPLFTWEINMQSLLHVLEIAREIKAVEKVFYPSSIAVFGENCPPNNTPNHVVLQPTTVYGITKAVGENWAKYYYDKFDVDVRSVRYPGIIGSKSLAGGGTTDYAVSIYHSAVNNELFDCFLSEYTQLPMLYMDDALQGTIKIMEADKENIRVRTSYNLAGFTASPSDFAAAIQRIIPDFEIRYQPDQRQLIADGWPNSIDDSLAREQWNWSPKFNIDNMSQAMIKYLSNH